ncbi:MAG: class II aldolase/adducin family protein [Pseudomonadales bacterium]|jgi:ribulose-5-phosphate 4-epimerase/fuculose-1-phosphate aldolase|nr:class II aldolase/adducin family protein [Pseudomonadales bacterium]
MSTAEQDTPTLSESPDVLREKRKRDVALGYRLFAANRWGDAGDGHISARDPERTDCFWTLRYGISYHRARVDDLVLVSPEGELVEGAGTLNMAAYYIHYPILRSRPDAVSAAHVHTGWGSPFSAEVRPIEPITQEACVFFEDHAIFDDEEVQVQSVEAGQRIADALGSNRAIILRNHGLLTVANRVDECVGSFVQMERVAEAHMKVRDARPISAEAARFAKADLVKFGAGRVAFRAMVDRHVGDYSEVL